MPNPEKQRDTLKWLTRFALYPLARRNALVDALFYDVSALTSGERVLLSAFENPEGAILVVWPTGVDEPIRRYPRVPAFLDAHGIGAAKPSHQVQAVAIAGVGSSALGTAALARNVADSIRAPVAGIVSGYGLLDVLAEGLGGWFALGVANAVSRLGDRSIRAVLPILDRSTKGWHDRKLLDTDMYVPGHPDSSALADILGSGDTAIRYVVGHSKGSLAIWNALEKLHCTRGALEKPLHDVTVVTLGAPAHLTADVLASVGLAAERYHQFIGSLDLLGWLNCHARDPKHYRIIPGAGHHLSSAFPRNVSVAEVMRLVLARPPVPVALAAGTDGAPAPLRRVPEPERLAGTRRIRRFASTVSTFAPGYGTARAMAATGQWARTGLRAVSTAVRSGPREERPEPRPAA